jgi:hypothetical protein
VRSVALAIGVGLLAAGCGDEAAESPADARTDLRVTVWPEGRRGDALSQTWTLRCDPSGGTHPAPEAACRALAANESALRPVPPDVMCTQIYGGPQVARITGTYRGAEITAWLDRTNGCEIARWDRLAPVFASDA